MGNRIDWPQVLSWMHRLHLAAILGQLVYLAWLPLCLVAIVMAGPIVGSLALFAALLTLQYPMFRLLMGSAAFGADPKTGDA